MNFAPAQSTRVTLVAAVFAAVVLFCAGMNEAAAQADRTWSGGGNGLWSDNLDWAGGLQLRSLGDYSVLFSGTSRTTNTNDIGSVSISTMSFTNNGSAGQNAVFTISGSSLNLTNATITTTATNGSSSLSSTGDSIGTSLTLDGSSSIVLGRGHSLSLTSGGISGSGSLTVAGDACLFLSSSNTYSGITYVTGAQVRTAANGVADGFNNSAFGTGSVLVSGSGSVALRNATALANNFTIAGNGLISSGTQGAIRGSFSTSDRTASISGTVGLSGNATITTAASNGIVGGKLALAGPVNLGSYVLTLAPDLAVTNTTSSQILISGPIGGAGSVVVTGQSQSRALLSGSSSYTGGTTLTSGTLAVGNARALGAGALAVNGGVLDLNGQSLTVGTLSGSSSGVVTSAVAGPASLAVSQSSNTDFMGSIQNGAGVVGLSKSGNGTLYLSGNNTYSGNTNVTAGQIRTAANGAADGSNNNAFGTGSVLVSGSGSVALRNATALANNFTISGDGGTQGAIRGSFSTSDRTASISGTVGLSGNATITTAASNGIVGGKLALAGPVNLGSYVLTLAPDLAVTNTTSSQILISGPIGGAGSVVVTGQSQSRALLSGSSSYTGGTTLTSGTLAVGNARALGAGALAVNGGVLDLNGQSLTVGTLSGSSSGVVTSAVAGPASLAVSQSSNTDFMGSIQNGAGVVGLSKSGNGTLYLSGNNTYSGNTNVTAGQIRTAANGAADGSNNNAFGTGSVLVSGSGSVALRNATALANNFTISGDGGGQGAIRGSFSTSNRTASVSGSVTLAGDASIATAASNGVTGSKLLLSGPIDIGSHVLEFRPGVAAVGRSVALDPAIVVTGTISGNGSTLVDGAGTLFMNGVNTSLGSTTVLSGALGGNGTIAGDVTIQSGARLTPGNEENTTGALGVGSLMLNSGALSEMAISGTSLGLFDQVVAVNNVNYGGFLSIDFTTAGFANFDSWQLFSGSGHSGHFSSVAASGAYGSLTFNYLGSGEWKATGGLLAEGQSLSFYEDNSQAIGSRYQAGQLVLVPEPSTIVFAGIGLFMVGWRTWSQRRSRRSSDQFAAV